MYTQDNLIKALAAVKAGMSIRAASRFFKIPKTTLFNKKTGVYPAIAKIGAPHTLKQDEELALTQWVLKCEVLGHKVTKCEFLNAIQVLCKLLKIETKFTNGRPGNSWFRSFLKRNPVLIKRMRRETDTELSIVKILQMRQLLPMPEEDTTKDLEEFLEKFGNFEESVVFKTLKTNIFWPDECGESSTS
ncbi:Leucine-rich repeat [Sergentomyia squamirostris]